MSESLEINTIIQEKPTVAIINDIDVLKEVFDQFIESDETDITVNINSHLRRPLREFKKLYPNIYYFAYRMNNPYRLHISKTKIDINLDSLAPKTKRLFVDNTGLKINPYTFNQAIIDKIKPFVNIDEWLELFQDALLFVSGEKEFKSKNFDLAKVIADAIKKNPMYAEWKNKKIKPLQLNYLQYPTPNITESVQITNKPNCNIYTDKNDGSYFVSIDLKEANYQILKLEGLCDSKNWNEYVSKFINNEYFGRIKLLRVKILRPCIPKNHQILWQNIILSVLDSLIKNNIISPDMLAVFDGDGIIIRVPKDKIIEYKEKCNVYVLDQFSAYDFRVDAFQLKQIKMNGYTAYAFINPKDGSVSFKCVNATQLLEVIDVWTKMNENENVDTYVNL